MLTPLAIVGMIAALLFGIYWGMPVRYQADPDEIDEALSDAARERHQVKRRTTIVTLLQRTATRGSHRRRSRPERRAFQFDVPDEPPVREGADDEKA
jgi:hypothetical protein